MNARPAPDDRLSAYLDGELDAAERADVDGYLAESPEWRAERDAVAYVCDALRGLSVHEAPPGFWEGVLSPELTRAARSAPLAAAAPCRRRDSRRRGRSRRDRIAGDPVSRSCHASRPGALRLARRPNVRVRRARQPAGGPQHDHPLPAMKIRSPRGLAVVAGVAVLAGLAPLALSSDPAATSQTGPGVQLLDDARRAAQEHDFSGVLEVAWSDSRGEHRSDVFVRSANGVLALGDRPQVIVDGARRFVQGPDGWLAVWSQETAPDVPPASDKWLLSVRDGPTVAGRPTREVDATDRRDDRVRERLYLDESTSLLLRREQLDTRGRTVRVAVGFTSIGEPAGAFIGALPAEAPSAAGAQHQPPAAVLREVAAPFRAPGTVGDRFRLAGRYDEDHGTLHLFYSDGLFSVSVFEQEGDLDPAGLPAGAESRHGRRARRPPVPHARRRRHGVAVG